MEQGRIRMIFMGIDPGKSGGIGMIVAGHGSGDVMPIVSDEIDATEVARILTDVSPDMVAIERAQAMPKQGVVGMFRYGVGFGKILGVLEALKVPHVIVRPQQWKKVVLEGTQKDKDAAISFVKKAYPMVDLTPGAKRKPHDGIADAVCLAEYARRL